MRRASVKPNRKAAKAFCGTVTGTYTVGDAVVPLRGFGFHDHSWGVRTRSADHVSHLFGFGVSDRLHYVLNRTTSRSQTWDRSYVVVDGARHALLDVAGIDALRDGIEARLGLVAADGEWEVACSPVATTEVTYSADYTATCCFTSGTFDGAPIAGMVEIA